MPSYGLRRTAEPGRLQNIRRRLRRLFAHPATEIAIGLLILASVTLTLVELSLSPEARTLNAVEAVNHGITLVFAVELTLRFAMESTGERYVRRYLKRWWVDLLAVVPSLILASSFRLLRGLRVLRYFRLLRLARLFTGLGNLLPYVLRRGAAHLGLIVMALFVTVVVGTALILSFEQTTNEKFDSFAETFWFSLYSLFAGEPIPEAPATIEGRIASVFVMFMGLSVFAAFTGTVSAFMIDRLQQERGAMEKGQALEDHVILCGLGQVGYRVMQVLKRLDQRILAIEKNGDSQFARLARDEKVPVIIDDVRSPGVLEAAGVARARAVMAVTDEDLTNLEIAIDARHLRPDIRVVLRLSDDRLAEKVHGGFNIQVAFSSSALAAPSFAAAAIDRSVKGSLDIAGRIYIHSEFMVPPESALAGRRVGDVVREYEVHTIMTRGEQDGDHWTPPPHHVIPGGCEIAVVGPFDRVEELKQVCRLTEDLVRAVTRD